jgi:ketosteroid isomerase-like protein
MGEQDNLQTIHKVYEAFEQGDVEGVISMLSHEVTWTTPGPTSSRTPARRGATTR